MTFKQDLMIEHRLKRGAREWKRTIDTRTFDPDLRGMLSVSARCKPPVFGYCSSQNGSLISPPDVAPSQLADSMRISGPAWTRVKRRGLVIR